MFSISCSVVVFLLLANLCWAQCCMHVQLFSPHYLHNYLRATINLQLQHQLRLDVLNRELVIMNVWYIERCPNPPQYHCNTYSVYSYHTLASFPGPTHPRIGLGIKANHTFASRSRCGPLPIGLAHTSGWTNQNEPPLTSVGSCGANSSPCQLDSACFWVFKGTTVHNWKNVMISK